jgi:membrane protease YdiL (CAAX protease family)
MPLLRHTYVTFAVVLALVGWLKLRGESLATFGLIAPRWLAYVGFGVLLTVIIIVADNVVRQYSTPLIVALTGANPHLDAETFAAIKGNLALYLMILPCVWAFAAFGEEFFYRGYLLTRLAECMGGTRLAWGLAIVVQAIVFGLAHWYQGPVGMVPIGIGALISGIATTLWGRNLWPAIVSHGLTDTLGFTMLYLGQPIS